MRHLFVTLALLASVASPALAQSRMLPAGSENAAQPPIDWSASTQRRWAATRHLYEGRSATAGTVVIVPAPDGDLD